MKSKWVFAIILVLVLLLISYISSLFITDNLIEVGDRISLIPIKGLITVEGSSIPFQGEGTSSNKILEFIEAAEKDENVKAIILEINSPGGSVVASSEIARAVKNAKKPTIAWIREIGASGAYWIASSADVVIADPMSVTGSIGVTSSYLQFSDLMKEYGVKYERLVAGALKDAGSPYKELTKEERAILEGKLKIIHKYFIDDITKNRNLDKKTVEELSNGMFYLGIEAYNLKLVDKLGDKSLVLNVTKELTKVEKISLVKYEEKKKLLDILGKISAYSSYFLGKGIGENLRLNQDSLSINAA